MDTPTQPESPTEALDRAVKIAGGQSAIARRLGVSQPTVWAWLNGGQLPAEHVLAVEAATGVSKHALRPDIYPDESDAGTAALDHAAPAPAREVRP